MIPSSELEKEVAKLDGWLRSTRRSNVTKIVTRGHILAPPFKLTVVTSEGGSSVVIDARDDRLTVNLNKVVCSPFRSGIELLNFGPDGVLKDRRALAPLNESYQKILEAFPPGSRFGSAELYAKVLKKDGGTQIHARRRWKELKYDFGFQVDWDSTESTYWRGQSEVPVQDPNPRPDDKKIRNAFLAILAQSQGREVSQSLSCNYCGAQVEFPGITAPDEINDQIGLIDHRRPVFQGGDDIEGNLQIFCQTCNNKKNSVCRNCPYEHKCDTCILAFPEKVRTQRLVLVLDRNTVEGLHRKFGRDVEAKLSDLIRNIALSKDNP